MASLSGGDLLPERRLDCGKEMVQECNLNSCLWARLPESLVEEILAKLPFSSLMRMCSVDKKWRDLILFSDTFPRCTSHHGRLVFYPGLVLPPCEKAEVYSSSTCRGMWETMNLQFPQQFMLRAMIGTAAGIVCFSSLVGEGIAKFIVCNPVTKCYKRFQILGSAIIDQPRLPTSDNYYISNGNCIMGMVVDSDTGHFKMIVGGMFGKSRGISLVYDSNSESWQEVGPVPDLERITNLHQKPVPVECGKNLYFHFKNIPYGGSLLKYHVAHETWSWILMPEQFNAFSHPWNVIEHNGKIVLVTSADFLCQVRVHSIFRALELQEEGPTLWLPINHQPFSTISELVPDMRGIKCFGSGDVVFLVRTKGSFTSGSGAPCNCRAESVSCYCKDVTVAFHQAKKTSARERVPWDLQRFVLCLKLGGLYRRYGVYPRPHLHAEYPVAEERSFKFSCLRCVLSDF